jgi:hypothetical protein
MWANLFSGPALLRIPFLFQLIYTNHGEATQHFASAKMMKMTR